VLLLQAREARNDILHSPNYELSENELNKFIRKFKEVLEIKDKHGNTPLKGEPGVEEALRLLDMVIILLKLYSLTFKEVLEIEDKHGNTPLAHALPLLDMVINLLQ
jgi:hypothetical protein